MPTDEHDTGIMEFAMVRYRNDGVFEQLSEQQREWLVNVMGAAMQFTADERGRNFPRHGAAAVIAQLNKAGFLSDEALALACVLCAALERWEREHAGS